MLKTEYETSLEGLDPDDKIIQEAKDRFKRAFEWENDFRKLYLADVKFSNGDSDNGWQWPYDIKRDRDINARPCLTINKTQQHVLRITNDGRKNPPAIKIKPTSGDGTFDAAMTWEGLVRNIEYESMAQVVYVNAAESQVEGGIGYWRVNHDFVDSSSFDQRIIIEPVVDQLGVLLDCDIKQRDGSDAKWGFVYEDVNKDEFRREYPHIELPTTGTFALSEVDDWITTDKVRIAEYYRIVEIKDELVYIQTPEGESATFNRSDVPAKWKKILDGSIDEKANIVRTRPIKRRQLQWYKIAAQRIIERRGQDEDGEEGIDSESPLKGQYIPIVRLPGREKRIDGKLERKGLVRSLKDAQRMYNFNTPLALDTPLPTPSGWTKMGDVKAGDQLLDERGAPVTVAGTSPIFINRDCYKVTFDDGSSIVADADHRWQIERRGRRITGGLEWSVLTEPTTAIDPKTDFIYVARPLELKDAELLLHPYTLGVWLGDGRSSGGSFTSGLTDLSNMCANLAACGETLAEPKTKHYEGKAYAADTTILGIRGKLKAIGVLSNKHIPAAYLRASRDQRLALLQGLMDTDGCFTKRSNQGIFVTTSHAIAAGFAELLRSLGIKPVYRITKGAARKFPNGNIYECADSYRFSFTPDPSVPVFRLTRKAGRQTTARITHARRTQRHRIISVEKTPSVPVRCVTIASASHLFLAGEGMVPTHNSGQVEFGALQTKTPWILPAAAIEGNQSAWAEANTKNAAYLTYKHIDSQNREIPAPQRNEPPGASPAFQFGIQVASAELEMASGQYAPQQQNPMLERTPAAIEQRERMGETATYDFIYNLSMAIRYTAVIILDLAPHIYDTERLVKILDPDGTQREIKIDPGAQKPYDEKKSGDKVEAIFNPTMGRYGVQADIGPAYGTRRQEAWNAFSSILQAKPELLNVIGDLAFQTSDFFMADKIADRIKRMIKATTPWLLDDNAPTPQMQELQQRNQSLEQQIAELLEKVTEYRVKLKGKDELRDIEASDAENRRMDALINAVKELHGLGLNEQEFAHQVVKTLHDMEQTELTNIQAANKDTLASQTNGRAGAAS